MLEQPDEGLLESPDIRVGDLPGELRVFDHGFVRLDASMADDLSVVNGARVSFAVRKEVMEERDAGLIRFLMRERHGSPFEHNAFRFHIRTPIFVAREWFRHRIGCLTGDTVVTFVNVEGEASKRLAKRMDELWRMWTQGERNGHALSASQGAAVDEAYERGESLRAIARGLGVGRRAVTRHVCEGSTLHRSARGRGRRMHLRVLNEETGEFDIGHIDEVINKGVQPIYELELDDGKRLKATENHRLLTDQGWRTLREAVGLEGVGQAARATRPCRLITNGEPLYRSYEWMAAQRQRGLGVQDIAALAGCSYHTIRAWLRRHDLQFSLSERGFGPGHVPWNKGRDGYRLNRGPLTQEQKAAIRRARSGPRSNFWRGGVTRERASIGRWTTEQAPRVHHRFGYACQLCRRRGGKLHAHHVVPVWLDDSQAYEPTNLISVCGNCHVQIHRTQQDELDFMRRFASKSEDVTSLEDVPRRRGVRLRGHPVRIIAVRYVGLRQTFDLCVSGPWHNFVANGIVVHNSFNEESARYHMLEGDFYVPTARAVRKQVGKPGSYSYEPTEEAVATDTIATFERIYGELYREYQRLIDAGVAKELARALLPFGIYTQFFWTLNARSLMNFVSLRNSPNAQFEIRTYAQAVERLFAEKMPVTHECFLEFGRKVP